MTQHDLKIWPQFFDDIAAGKKRAELRKDDRSYRDDDVLRLMEFDPKTKQYTGREVKAVVTHVQRIYELDTEIKSVMGLNPCLAPINQLAVLSIEVEGSAVKASGKLF